MVQVQEVLVAFGLTTGSGQPPRACGLWLGLIQEAGGARWVVLHAVLLWLEVLALVGPFILDISLRAYCPDVERES